jgi:hypothetical protein
MPASLWTSANKPVTAGNRHRLPVRTGGDGKIRLHL